MPRPSKNDQLRSRPPVALALVATFASAAALTVLYNHARSPQLTYAEIEQQTGQELSQIGYNWARVSIENGIATIEGEAPGESERVIAYDIVRRTLRPLMGKSRVIEGISSHLKLSSEAVTRLANANSARDASGSDYYLSADANLPYPPPPIVTGATDRSEAPGMPTTAALEPSTAQDSAAGANETSRGGQPSTAEPAVSTNASGTSTATWNPEPEAEASPTRRVTFESESGSDAVSSTPTEPPAERATAANEAASESDSPQTELETAAIPESSSSSSTEAPTPIGEPTDTTVAAAASTAGENSAAEPARQPAQAAAVGTAAAAAIAGVAVEATTVATAPIQTAALDVPAKPVEVAAAAPSTRPALDPTTDCKAEFAEALEQATVEFASNSAAIEKQSRPLLDKLAQIAKHCSRFRLVVEGHTDLSGSKAHNQTLSQKRADAVRWALVDRGVDMDHITAQGFGSSRPILRGTSEAANARNRRIEFSVLEPQPRGQNASAAR